MVSDASPSRAESLALVGGDLALDFVNTCSGRGENTPLEHLQTPIDVVRWAASASVLSPEDARWAEAEAQGSLGVRLLDEALALREDLYWIGAALAAREPAPPARIESLARTHALTLGRAALAPVNVGFGWVWSVRSAPVEAVLGPISLSAVAMLQQRDLGRVKQCPGDKCGWLFFDATKNKSRRWCEMEVCGNRAKQRRYARAQSS